MSDIGYESVPPVLYNDQTQYIFAGKVPADLATLKADPDWGDGIYAGAAFTVNQFVKLQDESKATWDGLIWTAFVSAAAAQAQAQAAPTPAEDPGAFTIPEVQDYVTDNPGTEQQTLDNEQAGSNRVTLVAWLEDLLEG